MPQIDCASLARIRTSSLFPSCVKAMYMGPFGTTLVPKMFDLHGLLHEREISFQGPWARTGAQRHWFQARSPDWGDARGDQKLDKFVGPQRYLQLLSCHLRDTYLHHRKFKRNSGEILNISLNINRCFSSPQNAPRYFFYHFEWINNDQNRFEMQKINALFWQNDLNYDVSQAH